MYFHEIAQELKLHMDPNGRAGEFVKRLVRDCLRDPMTDEEQEADYLGEYNPMEKNISINMLDKILEGDKDKWISKARAGRICSLYDGIDLADQVDRLFDGNKEHLQKFLKRTGFDVEVDELGSAVQDIFGQIYRGLAKGIHDVDIVLTIHDPKPTIKNLAGDRVYCEDGKLYIDGDVIELPIKLSDAQIYDFEAGYISALCDAYAEVLSRDTVTVDDIPSLPNKYQTNFYNQRKAYLSAESIQRSISEVYGDGENQFDILKEDAFRDFISKGLSFASSHDSILTMGMQPSRPDTGYGYIEQGEQCVDGIYKLRSFREKPDLKTAISYLQQGGFTWNSGMFLWSVETIVSELRKHTPEIAEIMDQIEPAMFTEKEQDVVDGLFPQCPKISIDYAVMEKTELAYVMPAEYGWSDVGTWGSLHTLSPRDESENAVTGDAVKMVECSGCMVRMPKDKQVVIQGLKDCIVAEHNNVLLICQLSEEQRIKEWHD